MTPRRKFLRLAALVAAWPQLSWSQQAKKAKPPPGILVNDVHSQLNSTRVFRIAAPESLDSVRALLSGARKERRPVCISGSRHAMGGQQFCADALMLDIRKLNRVLVFNRDRGLLEVESGMQWPQLLDFLQSSQKDTDKPWAFAQKQAGADRFTIGGSLAANIHGRGLAMPPFINDVESFRLVDARGNLVNCSRTENAELFRLAIGGYGLFGFVYSATLRLVPRRKLQRVVELRELDGLSGSLDERVRDGFLYGDFELALDAASPGLLRKGVFSCYRPVDDATPMPGLQKHIGDNEVVELLYLAHTNKSEAFRRYAAHELSTNGQIYWSDEQQMSAYPEDYHRTLDRMMDAQNKASDAISEICCERGALEKFMAEVREHARRDNANFVSATVRVVEQDRESFLAWARKPYACVTFHLHIEHSTGGVIRGADTLRRLVDIGLRHGGSYFPTYHRYALRRHVDTAYPQLVEFLKLKRKYDPEEHYQSEWYRHYKKMYFPSK